MIVEARELALHWTMICDGVVAIVVFESLREYRQRCRERKIDAATFKDSRLDGTYDPPWDID